MHLEQNVINLFVDNFANKLARIPFLHKSRSNVLYWFLTELINEIKDNKLDKSDSISINSKNELIVQNPSILFKSIIQIKHNLHKYNLQTSTYPKWMLNEYFKGFQISLSYLLKNKTTVDKLFKPRPVSGNLIKNQQRAIDLVKGSMSKEAVEKIIKVIFTNNAGPRSNKYKSYKSIVNLSERLYEEARVLSDSLNIKRSENKEQLDEQFKKTRITKKKCLKYILYWGAMSTLQHFKKKQIEVSSVKEQAFFGHSYKILRDAMSSLKMIKCVDRTFCPSVRSRTWEIKVMLPIGQSIKPYKLGLNNIEEQYFKIYGYKDKELFAQKRSIFASHYLPDKERAIKSYHDFKDYRKNIGYHYFIAKITDKSRAKDRDEHFKSARKARQDANTQGNLTAKFINKYSDPKAYEWLIKEAMDGVS